MRGTKQVKWIIASFICGLFLLSAYYDIEQDVVDLPEKEFVIIIPSYNNIKWYAANLGSVFFQKYKNYSIIYIDDCSTDGTFEAVKDFVASYGQQDRFTLIRNDTRKGALANLYESIHSLADQIVVITLDGDDCLKNPMVLDTLNKAYQDPNIWLTYGQYQVFPDGSLGLCKNIPQYVIDTNSYRKYAWVASHPRTFYAGLFKRIDKQDLLFEGDFFDVTWDQAMMFPMLEMAAGHIKFIPEVLYLYNQSNPLNDFKNKLQRMMKCEHIIRSKVAYKPLQNSPFA
jgi:glycosyltransferase involved in cell wall biosynthesis